MLSLRHSGRRFLPDLMLALLCLLGWPQAWAQQPGQSGSEQIPILGIKEAGRLLVNQAPPEYPVLAKVNYIQGRVRMRMEVSRAGAVTNTHVLSGNPILAAAALDSVRTWEYRPYMVSGAPTAFVTSVEIRFALHMQKVDLDPSQAESDFRRQVKPPEVLNGAKKATDADPSVRMRLLVSAEGQVIDSEVIKGIASEIGRAKKIIERWSFRPAHWGTLSVPWYLEVDVPVDVSAAQADVGSPYEP